MEKTTPSGSPLHRWSNGRKKTFQCYIVAFPPPVQGEAQGGSRIPKTTFPVASFIERTKKDFRLSQLFHSKYH